MALDRVVRAQASLEVANQWLYSIRAHENYEAIAVRAPNRRGELLVIPPVYWHAGEDLKVRHAASPCCCLTVGRSAAAARDATKTRVVLGRRAAQARGRQLQRLVRQRA